MKTTITLRHFRNAFNEIRPNQFRYEAIEAIFNYMEGLEYDQNIELEFDVIAICCQFTEYKNAMEACLDYNIKAKNEKDAINKLSDKTQVIHFDGGIVIVNF